MRFRVYGNVSSTFRCPKSYAESITVEALERLTRSREKIYVRVAAHDL